MNTPSSLNSSGSSIPIEVFPRDELMYICALYDLYVKLETRKSGVGAALLLAAEQYAKQHGFVRMDLTTAKTNFPAQSLYESLGWERDEIFYAYSKNPQG